MNLLSKIVLSMLLLIAVSVSPASATIHNVSGYILEDGTGLSGVTVTDNESIDTTVSNATGYYKLEGYTNQTSYILSANKAGYTTNTLQVDFLDADLTNKNITLVKTTLTAFLTDLSSIVTALTAMFIAVMALFMEPPLSLFIGIALFVMIIGLVARYLLKKVTGFENKRFISKSLTTESRSGARTEISNIMESEFKKKKIDFNRISKEADDIYDFKRSIDKGRFL